MTISIRTRAESVGRGPLRRLCLAWAAACCIVLVQAPDSRADTVASLLGNFTINQFCGLHLQSGSATVHYAVVYGQLPALRELHNADADGNGITSQAERDAYIGTLAPAFADALELTVDGVRVPLRPIRWTSSLPTEQGGFSLRVDLDLRAEWPASTPASRHTFQFANRNFAGKMGWHEIAVTPDPGMAVFDTDAYSNSATDGLTQALAALPQGGPLDERTVHGDFDAAGAPPGAMPLHARPASGMPSVRPAANSGAGAGWQPDTGWIASHTRELVDAISAPHLKPGIALWALLGALLLGAVHALSPGHGKTIVGAYLIGSRGTPRHALILGLTVTVTHTVGVFVLGFATLYASRFIVPERLFPILSLTSALLVLGMGVLLFVQRVRTATLMRRPPAEPAASRFVPVQMALAGPGSGRGLLLPHRHRHDQVHDHDHGGHSHSHDPAMHSHDPTMHSHGGGPAHSHLPPGASGEPVTLKSLLALGISGGLVPCPSAMVLLLAAIALNKTAYGMVLVLVFSLGLAITLTAVGLAFLFARNRFAPVKSTARWPQLLPIASAAIITLLGMALSFAAIKSFA